jgi:hypothetical protein
LALFSIQVRSARARAFDAFPVFDLRLGREMVRFSDHLDQSNELGYGRVECSARLDL